ncbi:MAG: hypothetical protein KFB94_02920 [Methylophilaceae bacterium]|nr:MAG: hypothetical protein KFB94_02920 [Methylophilaceae bacterium]
MKVTKKSIALAVGGAFALSLSATAVSAAENPFAIKTLSSGYQVADNHADKTKDGKCGEGKCGAEKKAHDGKCGADKKAHDGKCGADKKGAEGKCGEGKCGH